MLIIPMGYVCLEGFEATVDRVKDTGGWSCVVLGDLVL